MEIISALRNLETSTSYRVLRTFPDSAWYHHHHINLISLSVIDERLLQPHGFPSSLGPQPVISASTGPASTALLENFLPNALIELVMPSNRRFAWFLLRLSWYNVRILSRLKLIPCLVKCSRFSTTLCIVQALRYITSNSPDSLDGT